MRKIEIIVQTEKLEELKDALYNEGINNMTVSAVMRSKNDTGRRKYFQKPEAAINSIHEFKIEVVTSDDMGSKIINKLRETFQTEMVTIKKLYMQC